MASKQSGLPLANKNISDHPSGMDVTSPTDPKFKVKDVDRKMKAYGAVEAMRQGYFPSNRQIEETLQYVLKHSPIDDKSLSKEGQELIDDVRSIIDTAREIVREKNEDELMQNFLYATRHIDQHSVNPGSKVSKPIGKGEADEHANQAIEHLKTLGKLIFTNSEFRKILKDVGLLARDVGADAASKAAQKARPGEEDLNQVDEPAPSDQWIGPDGEKRGPNDRVPDTGLAAKRDQAKDQANNLKNKAAEKKDEAARQGQAHRDETAERMDKAVSSQPGDNTDGPSREQKEAGKAESKQIASEKADLAKEKGHQAKNKLLSMQDRIPQEHKDRARDAKERSRKYLDEKFPEERRDRFIYRLKKVIVEQQKHQDYQDAIEFFFDQAETYGGAAKDVTKQANNTTNPRHDPAFSAAERNLRTLLERFANNTSMQPLIDSVNVIYEDSKNDPELRSWFKDMDSYARKVLQEPGYVMKDECNSEGRKLRENGKGFFSEKYRPHREEFINQFERFFKEYANDPLNVQLGEDVKRLTKDLALDGEGNLKFKPHLWNDIRRVIIPQLAQHIGYVPIPRVEYTDNLIDLVIENLTLESQNLLPNVIELEARNYFKISPYSDINDKNNHSFTLSFAQIQADLRDVAFYYKKKSGFPRMSDSGLVDVFIGGRGISGKVHLESTGKPNHAFYVRDVKVTIDTLKFKVKDAKHSFLYSTFRTLATGLIKKQVAKAIQDGIRGALEQLDQQLSDIKERLDDASNRDDVSRSQVLKDSFQRKKEDGEQKAKESEQSSGTFKIVGSRDSKILDWSSKHSLVEKQGERQDKVNATSHGWKSPAFDIVSDPSKTNEFSAGNTSNSSRSGATTGALAGATGVAGTGALASTTAPHHTAVPQTQSTVLPPAQPTVVQSSATSGPVAGSQLNTASPTATDSARGLTGTNTNTGSAGVDTNAGSSVADTRTDDIAHALPNYYKAAPQSSTIP